MFNMIQNSNKKRYISLYEFYDKTILLSLNSIKNYITIDVLLNKN